MTKFRSCIDLHQGKVKQIVGSTLSSALSTNYTSPHPSTYYAKLYKDADLHGCHIIKLGPHNDHSAIDALAVWPGMMQIGGGVDDSNCLDWINNGASKVIITSHIFPNSTFSLPRLRRISEKLGSTHLVVDLSCKRVDDAWYVATNKWKDITDMQITQESISLVEEYCSELLVHAADFEGLCNGIDEDLVECLGKWTRKECTYAGGGKDISDLELVQRLSNGRVDLTFGSALDIFGGDKVRFKDACAWNDGIIN